MQLGEFIEKLNKIYEKYGDLDVCVDLDVTDECLQDIGGSLFTDNILDISCTTSVKGEVNGVYITNYIITEEDRLQC